MELLFINEKFHQLKKKETNKQISTTKTKQTLKLNRNYIVYIYIYIIHIIQIVQIYIPEFEGRLTFLIALDILFKNLSP